MSVILGATIESDRDPLTASDELSGLAGRISSGLRAASDALTFEADASLAAIVLADDADAESVLDRIIAALRRDGCRLGGFVQRTVDPSDGRGPFFALLALAGDRNAPLSAPRGSASREGARQCTVDDEVLAAFAVQTAAEIKSGVDLVVLNRFGRRECAGGGCRDELALALEHGTPALCVVRESHVGGWQAFGGELVCCLPPEPTAVLAWYDACRSRP